MEDMTTTGATAATTATMNDGSHSIDFCTFGMLIIDEIHFHPPKPPVENILGGAGTFAALGARIATQTSQSRSVGWIVDAGNDFPPELRETIASWGTSCVIRETPERKTTRGWNGYDAYEQRAFRYLTQKIRLDHHDLNDDLLRSKSFHMVCDSSRCIELVTGTNERRRLLHPHLKPPLWVWEPLPTMCSLSELERCKQALKYVDIVSPNHTELCAFFDREAHDGGGKVDKSTIEELCEVLLESGIGTESHGSIVVRSGKEGCYAVDGRSRQRLWLPAYQQDQGKVVDPTGGGNTFLGGMAVTVARRPGSTSAFNDIVRGAVAGSVAASFAIEQIGVPMLSIDECGETIVNGDSFGEREAVLRRRLVKES